MNNDIENKIRNICTYHSDGGTSGYNLSEEQFQKVLEVVAQAVQEAKREEKANIEQHMVFIFKKLPSLFRMSDKRKDILWSYMCQWTDEYFVKLKTLSTHPSRESGPLKTAETKPSEDEQDKCDCHCVCNKELPRGTTLQLACIHCEQEGGNKDE